MSKGSGWHGDPADHSKISKLGGKAVFDYYDSEYMATIGSKGGLSVSKDKKHMAVIGRKGGVAKAKKVKNGKK